MDPLFDTHCHLNDAPLAGDLDGVLERARAAGVTWILVPGTDRATSATAAAMARERPGIVAGVGLHPWFAGREALDVADLARLARAGGVAAIGEVGLDGAVDVPDLDAQEPVFRAQAALARDLGLPLLVHCRQAYDRTLAVLQALGAGGPGGIFHSFAGSREIADRVARLGFLLGVGGVATRPAAKRVRAVLADVPLERLVLETDAPWIGTARVPRGQVQPADVAEVAAALAALKGVPAGEVARVTTANARALLFRS
jgi:TatD DNase family protein